MLLVLESRLYHQILHLFYEYTQTVVIGVASTERYIATRSCILLEQYTKNVELVLLVLQNRLYHPILHLFYEYTQTVVIGAASTERSFAIRSCISFEKYTKNVVIGVAGTGKSTLPPDLALLYEYIKRLLLLALLLLKDLLPSGLVFCLDNIQRML